MLDPAHMTPALHLVYSQIKALMDEVATTIQDMPRELENHGGAIEHIITKCKQILDHSIRMMVYEGHWASVGITDVRELYDLDISINVTYTPKGRRCIIGVQLPNVVKKLSAQDDPNAN